MLLGTLGASLLGNILAGKGINRADEGVVRAGYGNKKGRKNSKMDFIKMRLDLMVFVLEIFTQNIGWGLCKKS